jgi:hypothetical protein
LQRKLILIIILALLTAPIITSHTSVPLVAGQTLPSDWQETEPMRIIIQSTSDWGRILFDDLNGTNSNGIRIRTVLTSGWFTGKYIDYALDVGRQIPWQDQAYNQTIVRHGDLMSFYKGLLDFRYSEVYADVVFDVDLSMPQIYVWLMSGGNGTTTFQINNLANGGTIWRDIIVGNGVSQQVRRVMSPQPFFHPARSESVVVAAWLSVALVVVIFLNFPILEFLVYKIKRRRHRGGRNRNGK